MADFRRGSTFTTLGNINASEMNNNSTAILCLSVVNIPRCDASSHYLVLYNTVYILNFWYYAN